MKIFRMALIIMIFFMVGCTVKYLPISDENVTISEDFGVVKKNDYIFAAENRYWIKEPTELSNYFTSFYVSIKNRTANQQDIEMKNFALIDENGNQYDVVSNEYIELLIQPNQLDFIVVNQHTDSNLLDTDELFNEHKSVMERWYESKENLIRYSFRFGTVFAGARKSGYIFFPRVEDANKRLKLIYKEAEINFSRVDEGEEVKGKK